MSLLLWAPAPLFAQSTVEEFQAFIDEYRTEVEAYHAAEYANENDEQRVRDRLKRKLKDVLYRAEAEYQRTTQFAVGYEGIWTVTGTSTQIEAGTSRVIEIEGELQIEREAAPATFVTGPIEAPAAGEHLDVSFGEGEVYVIEFQGNETSVRKVSNRLRGWMTHGKSTINRDRTLTLESFATGPDAELTILESSSAGALEALGLTPGTSHGFTSFEVEGQIKGAGKSSFEGLGKLDQVTKSVRGQLEAGVTDGLGEFQLDRQDDGSVRMTFKSEAASGYTKLTRALDGISNAALQDILFQLNKLDLRLRYPRAEPVRYRANSRRVMARFAPNPELDPDGVEAWVIELIDGAKVSIDMAVFEFQLMRVSEALIRAQQRGVDVRVVHDADDVHERPAVFLRRHQVKGDADTAMLQVRDDLGRVSLMHNKFMIIDGETVWTGSTNLTPNAMFAQDNNALLFRSKELAAIYKVEFEEMFTDQLFGAMDRDATANTRWSFWKDVQPGDKGGRDDWLEIDRLTSLQVYFAPEDNAMDRLLELVKGAKKSIHFLAFSFASDTLASAMKERMQDGVEVAGIFEGMGTITIAGELHRAGAAIRVKSIGNMKLHHKVIVIDGEIVCSGSFNFSDSADAKNDENMVVMRSEPLAGKVLEEFKSIWAASNGNDERVVGTGEAAQSGTGVSAVIEGALGDDE